MEILRIDIMMLRMTFWYQNDLVSIIMQHEASRKFRIIKKRVEKNIIENKTNIEWSFWKDFRDSESYLSIIKTIFARVA